MHRQWPFCEQAAKLQRLRIGPKRDGAERSESNVAGVDRATLLDEVLCATEWICGMVRVLHWLHGVEEYDNVNCRSKDR